MSTPDLSTVDHFTCDNSFLYRKYQPKAYAAAALKKLREATAYRPHYYTVPGADQQPIPANNAVVYEVKMLAGSIIWAITFWDQANLPEAFNIVSRADGRKMFTQPIPADVFLQNSQSTGIWYLDEPFCVVDPGTIQCELYNANSATSGFPTQLILLTAQPHARQDPQ